MKRIKKIIAFVCIVLPFLLFVSCKSNGNYSVNADVTSSETSISVNIRFNEEALKLEKYKVQLKNDQIKYNSLEERNVKNETITFDNLTSNIKYNLTIYLYTHQYVKYYSKDVETTKLEEIEGLNFYSKEITYDGQPHSLEVSGLDSSMTVTYSQKDIVNAGEYQISATVSKEGYKDKILTAMLKINKALIDGIKFENKDFPYDGKSHTILVENIDDSYSVTYSSNNIQTKPGTYEIIATISKDNFEDKILKAILTITKVDLPYSLSDTERVYTGKEIELVESKDNFNFIIYDSSSNVINSIVNPGMYLVTYSYSGNEYYKSKQGTFKVNVIAQEVNCNVVSQVTKLSNPTLDISSDDFDGVNYDYTVTYFNSLGEKINRITKTGDYTALINVKKTDYFKDYTKAVGLTVYDDSACKDKVCIDKLINIEDKYTLIELKNRSLDIVDLRNLEFVIKDQIFSINSLPNSILRPFESYKLLISKDNNVVLNGVNIASYADAYVVINTSIDSLKIELDGKSDEISVVVINSYNDYYLKSEKAISSSYSFKNAIDEFKDKVLNPYLPTAQFYLNEYDLSPKRLNDFEIEIVDYDDSKIEFSKDLVINNPFTKENLNQNADLKFKIQGKNGKYIIFGKSFIIKDEEGPVITKTSLFRSDFELNEEINFAQMFSAYDDFDHEIEITDANFDKGLYQKDVDGCYLIKLRVADSSNNVSIFEFYITVGSAYLKLSNINNNESIRDVNKNNHATPQTGNVKILVVPVAFESDEAYTNQDLFAKLDRVFNAEDLEYQSVSSYYKNSSYNKLNLTFDIYNEYVNANYDIEHYKDSINSLFKEIIGKIDSKVNFANYDSDSDNYIDGIWFINNLKYSTNSQNNLLWAFETLYSTNDKFDGLNVGPVANASYYFMDPEGQQSKGYGLTDLVSNVYIHETGHMLGLEDLYGNPNSYNFTSFNTYTMDMMDSNVFDHNAVNKILLDWIDPYVVSSSGIIKLKSASLDGEAIIIKKNVNTNFSRYSEYIVVEFFTPDLNNELPSQKLLKSNRYGLRIYHFNGTLDNNGRYFYNNLRDDSNPHYLKLLPVNPDLYDYTNKKVVLKDNVLYSNSTQIFGDTVYSDYKYSNGNEIDFTIQIVDMKNDEVTLKIDFS